MKALAKMMAAQSKTAKTVFLACKKQYLASVETFNQLDTTDESVLDAYLDNQDKLEMSMILAGLAWLMTINKDVAPLIDGVKKDPSVKYRVLEQVLKIS